MTGWNMPPGCNESDIPGNRDDDVLWEHMIEKATKECQENAYRRPSEQLRVLCRQLANEATDTNGWLRLAGFALQMALRAAEKEGR